MQLLLVKVGDLLLVLQWVFHEESFQASQYLYSYRMQGSDLPHHHVQLFQFLGSNSLKILEYHDE